MSKPPYVQAAEWYQKWGTGEQFVYDVDEYLKRGVVIATPVMFGMAKIIDLANEGEEPQPAWFVRMAVGNLFQLLQSLPAYLPKICFCRKGDNRLRVYSYNRLLRKSKLWATH